MAKYTWGWCFRREKRGVDGKNILKNNGRKVLKFNKNYKPRDPRISVNHKAQETWRIQH